MIISEYLQIFEKRVFFDISYRGCGSGCVYCFTRAPEEEQQLLPLSVIDEMCNYILSLDHSSELVVSFCPNTEPMKSAESRSLVLHAINRLHRTVRIIQIATKELIPLSYLEQLNAISSKKGNIRISVSLPFLIGANNIEPFAASVNQRLQNFINIKLFPRLLSVLYLRPFNIQMLHNQCAYEEIINQYLPDDVCLGAEFVKKVGLDETQYCTFMYDKGEAQSIFTRAEIEDIFTFADFLRTHCGCKVFYSSICNISNSIDYGFCLNLSQYDSRYCLDCDICK